MDYSDSEEYDNDSVVVSLDDDEDIESDTVHEADILEGEFDGVSGGSSPSDSTVEYGDAEQFQDSDFQISDDSSWHPHDPLENVDGDSTSSTFRYSPHHSPVASPVVTAEEDDSASEDANSASEDANSASEDANSASEDANSASGDANSASSSSQQENSAVSAPSTTSTQPFIARPGLLATPEYSATSTVPGASTSSSEAPGNPALPVKTNEDHRRDPEKKTSDRDSPRGKKRKKDSENPEPLDSEEDSSGQTCPICMDEWSNSGAHRLCCLKCGHLYGESCIRRWLTSAAASSGRCPQCNTKARIRDIRPLFARSLRAIDTAERDRLAVQLEDSKRKCERLELEVTKITMADQMRKAEVEKLQAEKLELLHKGRTGAIIIPETGRLAGGNAALDEGGQILTPLEGIAGDGNPCHFTLRSTVEIAREGGCRVAAHCETLNLVVVSQRSTNPLFPGFGVKKVDSLEFRATQFVPAHPKPIRDLAFAPPTAIHCHSRSAQGGIVLSFDVRRTSAPLSRISDPDEISPVISLVPIPPSPVRALPSGGLVSCHLSSCWAHDSSQPGSHRLPYEGPFTALRYESNTQHFLVSARPSVRTPHARHSVCERALRSTRANRGNAENSDSFTICNPPVHTFLGGTSQRVLSRPCLLPVHRDLVVAAHQESSSTVALWSVGTGGRVATIPASDPVIDVCPLTSNGDTHLALLTEKMLRLYRIH